MPIKCCFGVQPGREMTVEQFKTWLRRFNTNHDGCISEEELREAIRSLHVRFGWWKAREGMKQADSDRNGFLDSPQEIEKLVSFAQKRLHMKITKDN